MSVSPARREPVRTAAGVEALLRVQEDAGIEFKQTAWADGMEAAKDVAAFANADGGQIILGVEEDGSARACGFRMWSTLEDAKAVQRARAQLTTSLRPRDFVDHVALLAVPLPSGIRTCVITVPPSGGLIAVATGSDRDSNFGFPTRSGRETRWMAYNEVEDRMLSEERVAMHRFRLLAATTGERPVALIAGVWFPGYREPAKLETVRLRFHDLSESHVILEWANDVHFYGAGLQANVTQCKLKVPLALVRRVFPREGGGVHIELRADLLWDGIAFGFGRVISG